MRVIAGSARRINLVTPSGQHTRPTTDRIKETLFNILMPEIPGCRFLDLFAGSGGIGIEALSRGAREAVFVENNRKAVSIIQENLTFTRLSDRARVMGTDAVTAIRQLSGKGSFDIIFMDPPYRNSLYAPVLSALQTSDVLGSGTLVIAESLSGMDFSFAEDLGFDIVRVKDYKSNKHVFLSRSEKPAFQ